MKSSTSGCIVSSSERMLDRRVEALDRKVEALDRRVEVLDRKVEVLDRKVEALDHKVDLLDEKVVALDKKVAVLDERVTGIDAKFDGSDKRTAYSEQRFDKMFLWLMGIQLTTLVTIVGGLFGCRSSSSPGLLSSSSALAIQVGMFAPRAIIRVKRARPNSGR